MSQDRRDRIVLSAAAGALPLSVLINVRDLLQLDNLHLVLFELLLLLLARVFLFASPSSAPSLVQAQPQPASIRELPAEKAIEPPQEQAPQTKPASSVVEKANAVEIQESKLYPQALVDRLLWHFVSYADPLLLPLLPPTAADPSIPICELEQWNVTFTQDALMVRQHPDESAIYASTNHFPNVPLRSIYEMMVNLEVRSSWDSLTERAELLERLPHSRGGAVYLALRSLFPIKAKDLVLLSAHATLPPTTDGRKRVISAARSVEHPVKPPGTPGYARMNIKISGFILEEHPKGGTIFTQIADLSSLGSWIPAKIVNFITTNALPRGMRKVALAAETTDWPAHRKVLQGDDWMPPVLGTGHHAEESISRPIQNADGEVEDLPLPSESRALSTQLTTITERLTSLEAEVKAQNQEMRLSESRSGGSASGWWWPFSYLWPSATSSETSTGGQGDVKVQRRVNRRGTETQLAVLRQVAASVGGVASIAALAAWVWTRRRR